MPIIIGVGAFAVVLGVVGAVAASGHKTGSVSPSPGTQVQGEGKPAPAAGKPKRKTSTATFGDTFRWNDGLAVNVSRVRRYTPGEFAAGAHKGDQAITVTVKITNGSPKPFDTALVSVNVKAGADGVGAEQIFDSGVGDVFSGSIVPGSAATSTFAYDIPRGTTGALDIEVQPDSSLQYASEHWVGRMP